jgi:hypothetical protein
VRARSLLSSPPEIRSYHSKNCTVESEPRRGTNNIGVRCRSLSAPESIGKREAKQKLAFTNKEQARASHACRADEEVVALLEYGNFHSNRCIVLKRDVALLQLFENLVNGNHQSDKTAKEYLHLQLGVSIQLV